MKKEIFKYLGLALIAFLSMSIWGLASILFSNPETNNWLGIVTLLILFFIVWLTGAIVLRDGKTFLIVSLVGWFSQFFFVWHWGIILVVIFSFAIVCLSRNIIWKEVNSRLELNIWGSLRVGRRLLVLALAIMLAGQYYFFKNPQIESSNFPKLKISHTENRLVLKIISLADRDLLTENGEAASVNDFVNSKINNKYFEKERNSDLDINQINLSDAGNLDNYSKESMLESGVADVSKMAKRDVSGEEKMSNVFLEIINNKINDLLSLNVDYGEKDIPIAHLFLTIAIFLGAFSLGMLLSFVSSLMVVLFIKVFIWIDFLSISKKAVNMEVISVE